MTVGSNGNDSFRGFAKNTSLNATFGSLASETFVLGGQTYTVELAAHERALSTVYFESDPNPSDADMDKLKITIKDKTYDGTSFTYSSTGYWSTNHKGLSLTSGASVTFKIAVSTTAPEKVTGLTLTAGDGQISASWTVPGDGGSAITGYDVEYRVTSTGGAWTDASHSGTGASHTITGLTNGTEYDVQVRAVNSVGDGPNSDTAKATPKAATAPEKVTGLTLTAGDGQISASWTAPGNGGSAITGYDVEYRVTSAGGSWTDASHSGTGASHTITGLTNGTEYDVQVRAVNSVGDGPNSDTAKATPTKAATAPEKVTGLTLTSGDGQISVSWTAPGNGGSAITGYDVEYRTSPSGTWTDASDSGTDTTHTKSGLTNGTAYDFRVRAVNAEGNGDWSDTETATPTAPPSGDAPATPSITATGYDETIVVLFTKGSSGGPPTHYEVRWWSSSHSTEYEIVRGTGFAIDSVANGTEYSVQGRAHNGAGSSGWSSTVKATPVAATPGNAPQPRSVKVQPGNTKVLLEWKPGIVHTGEDETDHYEVRSGDTESAGSWSDVGTALSHEIGSPNGENYWFHVRACAGEALGTRCSATVSVRGEATATPLPWRVGGMNGEGIVVESGRESLKVTWPTASYADSYEIQLGTYEWGFTGEWVATTNATSHNLRNLTNGEWYLVRLRGVNAAGTGPVSSHQSGVPESSAPMQFMSAPPPGRKVTGGIIGLSWQAGQGMSPGGYEVQSAEASEGWQAAQSKTVADTTTEVSGLTLGTSYTMRVRALYHTENIPGGWSETLTVTPEDPKAALKTPFADLSMANGSEHEIDLSGHFSGAGLSYAVSVTTTHKKTGKVKTGPLNSVARNKVTGSLEDGVLTLTAGPKGEHVLGMEITATDADGGFGGAGHGFGGAGSGFEGHGFGGGSGGTDRSYSLSDLSDLMKSQGFAISLNRPLPGMGFAQEEAPADDAGMQLTLWGQGAGGGSDGAMFWGMDASMGERWMTGIAFAESGAIAASGLKHGDARVSGFAESEVTAVYPYARGRFASGLELWSLAGWGKGRVDSRWTGFAPGSGPVEIDLAGGLGFSLGMAGAEQVLYEADGLSVSAVGDAGWSRLAVSGGTADGVSATVTRTRVAVSGRYAEGGLASSLRIGGRVDGGDGETASGAEVSGEVRHAWGRWEVGAQGRWYTAETTGAGFGERGVRAAVGLRAKADGTGLAFALSPGWGASGAQQGESGLLGTLDGDEAEHTPAAHLDGRISWGIQVPGLIAHREMLRPYAEFSLTDDDAHRLRTGVALEGSVRTNLALEHRKDAAGPAEHGVMLRLDTGF